MNRRSIFSLIIALFLPHPIYAGELILTLPVLFLNPALLIFSASASIFLAPIIQIIFYALLYYYLLSTLGRNVIPFIGIILFLFVVILPFTGLVANQLPSIFDTILTSSDDFQINAATYLLHEEDLDLLTEFPELLTVIRGSILNPSLRYSANNLLWIDIILTVASGLYILSGAPRKNNLLTIILISPVILLITGWLVLNVNQEIIKRPVEQINSVIAQYERTARALNDCGRLQALELLQLGITQKCASD